MDSFVRLCRWQGDFLTKWDHQEASHRNWQPKEKKSFPIRAVENEPWKIIKKNKIKTDGSHASQYKNWEEEHGTKELFKKTGI